MQWNQTNRSKCFATHLSITEVHPSPPPGKIAHRRNHCKCYDITIIFLKKTTEFNHWWRVILKNSGVPYSPVCWRPTLPSWPSRQPSPGISLNTRLSTGLITGGSFEHHTTCCKRSIRAGPRGPPSLPSCSCFSMHNHWYKWEFE